MDIGALGLSSNMPLQAYQMYLGNLAKASQPKSAEKAQDIGLQLVQQLLAAKSENIKQVKPTAFGVSIASSESVDKISTLIFDIEQTKGIRFTAQGIESYNRVKGFLQLQQQGAKVQGTKVEGYI